jgi:hypothetical protein
LGGAFHVSSLVTASRPGGARMVGSDIFCGMEEAWFRLGSDLAYKSFYTNGQGN